MPGENPSFIKVDDLTPRITVEQVMAYYGVQDVEMIHNDVRGELRSRCFLPCGKVEPTGDRALCFQINESSKPWRCFQKGCAKSGNLVSLCDLLRPGQNQGGRPRGQRFKDVASDLVAMSVGQAQMEHAPPPFPPPEPAGNVPLSRAANERARALVNLDEKFLPPSQVEAMPRYASRYFRVRSWLTDALARSFRMGYLPRDTGEDHRGGTLRGHVVYPYLDEEGNVLTWFGRDPEWGRKHAAWLAGDRTEKEPGKFRFIKGFLKGHELYGQDRVVTAREETREQLKRLGLLVTAGPNDVMRLAAFGVPAVALCGQEITQEQAEKVVRLARLFSRGVATLLLSTDEEGEKGMKQCLGKLAQMGPVRLGLTSKMHDGRFVNRQVESLTVEEWRHIESFLHEGMPAD